VNDGKFMKSTLTFYQSFCSQHLFLKSQLSAKFSS